MNAKKVITAASSFRQQAGEIVVSAHTRRLSKPLEIRRSKHVGHICPWSFERQVQNCVATRRIVKYFCWTSLNRFPQPYTIASFQCRVGAYKISLVISRDSRWALRGRQPSRITCMSEPAKMPLCFSHVKSLDAINFLFTTEC